MDRAAARGIGRRAQLERIDSFLSIHGFMNGLPVITIILDARFLSGIFLDGWRCDFGSVLIWVLRAIKGTKIDHLPWRAWCGRRAEMTVGNHEHELGLKFVSELVGFRSPGGSRRPSSSILFHPRFNQTISQSEAGNELAKMGLESDFKLRESAR